MVKDFMTMNWGYLPPTSRPYPASPKVNAFIGPSGHGKTTIWDGLRLVLGDTTFENHRNIIDYVHPNSTWAIIRVAFHNLPVNGNRPFERFGYKEDQVVVCCRCLKNADGRWGKEYYIFDGEFIDLSSLAENSKAYKQRLKIQEDFRDILEQCLGITKAFRRLMAMNPETVREMISLSPNQLFQKIYELKGIKEIQDRYKDAKKLLDEQRLACDSTEKEVISATTRYEELKAKAELYAVYSTNIKHRDAFDIRIDKLAYYETVKAIDEIKKETEVAEAKVKKEQDVLLKLEAEIAQADKSLLDIEAAIETMTSIFNEINDRYIEKSTTCQQQEELLRSLNTDVEKLALIKLADIDELRQIHTVAMEELHDAEFEHRQSEQRFKMHLSEYTRLSDNKHIYPHFVPTFRSALNDAGIDYLMMADSISVKPKYKEWQRAIEAYLGNERYRIIVSNGYLQAKKLQEHHRYTARLSQPKNAKLSSQISSIDAPSILSVLDITHPEKVGGYLIGLDKIYLVNSVEEGHELQKKGLISITKKGLLQDNDGSVFRDPHTLCCGRLALETEKQRVSSLMENEKIKTCQLQATVNECRSQVENLAEDIQAQEMLAQLPEYIAKQEACERELLAFTEQRGVILVDRNNAETERKELYKKHSEIKFSQGSNNKSLQSSNDKIEELMNYIKRFSRELVSSQSRLDMVTEKLIKDRGLSQDDIDFIFKDVQGKDYIKDDGELYTSAELKLKRDGLNKEIEIFEAAYKDIDDKITLLVKTQEGQIEILINRLQIVKETRVECEQECNDCLFELKNHVRTAIKEYISEFETLADLLRAKTKGKLEEIAEDPDFWELHMEIGFPGKELSPVNGPKLSSGERACCSLMLLLAAVSNMKEGRHIPVMFLDEPRSRLDDARGNEIGQLLQVTDVQYFITHQQGESLKSVDWINHGFTCILRETDKKFAPPMIYKKMRES
ncbi:AAA family ATPase [Pelosinus sp. UFO1]|uniref:AAA family ATPase n=1 Tax=Pelosinus sp. UFO1 TaxID=484770 RepID=UPI0004D0CFD5|nr:AAA family ATPase [Pelosinus sp. UFO1]AIF53528.1 SMC domain protein [Pelosinus sp. UFO1]